ncbi:TetR/AcrR family transcriptional regulator [Actinomadura rubrisoli]|uniref:TetR/AcrR family transcriptional regulator n=1 Tax=Actinomadura rubrisoli TaxID=2530368 RepID=A0A4V2YRJ7_9ACTN|nr:TetR/AcrR family transcriptional regulator [Actinomadura rubrisoli]TDD65997.1 TetR/AcrR family transcriptional regulator [Actinomadura rubrisoli]
MGRTREFDTEAAVAAAVEVFRSRGYEATSIQDLVEATGVGRGSLYAAFGSKDGLYELALRHYAQGSIAGMAERLAGDAPVREAIRGLLLALVDDTIDDPARRGCLMTNTAVERLPGDTVAGRIVGDSFDRVAGLVETALRRGRARGELPPDADVTALADFVTTTIQGLRVQGKTGADRRRLAAVVDTALRALPVPG